jgi:hypothetical protein
MSLQIGLIILASGISMANALMDLKTTYLYDLPNYIVISITCSLFIIEPNHLTWQRFLTWFFINIFFLLFFVFKIIAFGDIKFILTLSLPLAFLNPFLLYIFTFIILLFLSVISFIKKYLLANKKTYPAGWIIFLSYIINVTNYFYYFYK